MIVDQLPDQLEGWADDVRNEWLTKNFQNNSSAFIYPQVFEDRIGFQQNLSILDMLFNTGPGAGNFFMQSSLTK